MKIEFVFLPSGHDPYLLQCWLRGLPDEASVWLLSDHEQARDIAESHAAVCNHFVPDGDGTLPRQVQDALAKADRTALVIPLSLNQIPMRYRPGNLMADLAPHYDLLQHAWAWGFREVRFVAHQNEERVALPYLLDAFHNRHRGQRCFLVGNGPSLQQLDMTRLKNEITLGSNRCFLGYESWGFPFTYWGCYDKFQIENYHDIYEAHVPTDTVKFFPVEYAPIVNMANGCPINSIWPEKTDRAFSADPTQTYVGFTVTYMLLQIAACMGCDPIILVGTDHRYNLSRRGYSRYFRRFRRRVARQLRGGRVYEATLAAQRAWKKIDRGAVHAPALWSTQDATHPTHFTAAYTDGGKNQFLPPEPEEAERDFDCAHAWAQANGVQIQNATPGTALKSFPRINFDDLF
ncbi:MAG: hypothetical protein L3K26_03735 [Candidatus Hydrogenedentes bacterium]|nr:hypothetical protein [Candidatus Hydrogenedentota bacterium]